MNYNCDCKNLLVAGVGKSGIAATKLLIDMGARVILYDDNENVDTQEIMNKLDNDSKVSIFCKSVPDEIIENVEAIVLSPGIPVDSQIAKKGFDLGLKVLGEVELAYRFEKGDVMAITGTNGKTTTTALVGEIMKKAREKVFVAGNIGKPYTETVSGTDENSCSVLEVSSFQLETIYDFKPKVSAILNITPDHLNRHHTMENYIKTKLAVASNQSDDDVIVLNYDDEILRKAAQSLKPRVIFFSSLHELKEGVFLRNGKEIIVRIDSKEMVLCNVDDLKLPGIHNYENVMAATAMAWMMGVSSADIHDAVISFKSVEHRIEFVCEKDGVKYYNDSKGTNPDAAIKGIQSMVRPTYLIGGGYNKNADFTEWIEAFDKKVTKLVLIGETADQIADTCERLDFKDYVKVSSLKEAVSLCSENAVNGDAVLLSPACASWDMFSSYEERGRLFKKYVLE